jgi:hypothetical protein
MLSLSRAGPKGSASAALIATKSPSSLKGFSMKSTAPPFIARTAVSMSPFNVITIIGSLKPRDLSCYCSSRPPIPGIRTDGGLITGQNPVSSEATAKALLERLHAHGKSGETARSTGGAHGLIASFPANP